jgi:hypothetical protein
MESIIEHILSVFQSAPTDHIVTADLHRRVNEHVGGQGADRQNFSLDQVNAAHDALADIVRIYEQELRNAAA